MGAFSHLCVCCSSEMTFTFKLPNVCALKLLMYLGMEHPTLNNRRWWIRIILHHAWNSAAQLLSVSIFDKINMAASPALQATKETIKPVSTHEILFDLVFVYRGCHLERCIVLVPTVVPCIHMAVWPGCHGIRT